MRSFLLALMGLVLVSVPVAGAHPREAQPWEVRLAGGLSLPTEPRSFADNWKTGGSFGAGLAYRVCPEFSVGVEGDYESHPLVADRYAPLGTNVAVAGGAATSISGLIMFIGRPIQGARWGFSFRAGGGAARFKIKKSTVSVDGRSQSDAGGSETRPAFRGALELGYRAGASLRVVGEAGYALVLLKGHNAGYAPLRLGLEFRL